MGGQDVNLLAAGSVDMVTPEHMVCLRSNCSGCCYLMCCNLYKEA